MLNLPDMLNRGKLHEKCVKLIFCPPDKGRCICVFIDLFLADTHLFFHFFHIVMKQKI